MTSICKPMPGQVGQLVNGIEQGRISLPDLQRPFVWPATRVRDLFDSMFLGYPVGELMFWDVPAEGDSRSISGMQQVQAAHQIVDGQQRLTSLYAEIKGAPVRDEGYRSKHIAISDSAPAGYWPGLLASRGHDVEWTRKQFYWHVMPENWHEMPYEEFPEERRGLMAHVIRDGFDRLGSGSGMPSLSTSGQAHEVQVSTLDDLLRLEILQPGDLLDPIDPNWSIDAVITDERTVRIDGEHDFDDLDDAARHVGVTNLDGFEFWALERDGSLASLAELVAVRVG